MNETCVANTAMIVEQFQRILAKHDREGVKSVHSMCAVMVEPKRKAESQMSHMPTEKRVSVQSCHDSISGSHPPRTVLYTFMRMRPFVDAWMIALLGMPSLTSASRKAASKRGVSCSRLPVLRSTANCPTTILNPEERKLLKASSTCIWHVFHAKFKAFAISETYIKTRTNTFIDAHSLATKVNKQTYGRQCGWHYHSEFLMCGAKAVECIDSFWSNCLQFLKTLRSMQSSQNMPWDKVHKQAKIQDCIPGDPNRRSQVSCLSNKFDEEAYLILLWGLKRSMPRATNLAQVWMTITLV